MSRLDCDIVRDLTPSYLEEICSDSSRQAVEEHLTECEKCKNYIQMMRQTELVSKKAEQGELDYMKKVKHHFNQKNRAVIGCCVLAVCFLLTSWAMLSVMPYIFGGMTFWFYCATYAPYVVLAVALWLILAEYRGKLQKKGMRIAVGTLGVVGLLYSVGLMEHCIRCAQNNVPVFGIPVAKLGPVVAAQLVAVAIVEFTLTALLAAQTIREEARFGILHVITLLGAFVSIALHNTLFNMESLESYIEQRNTILTVFAAEGIVIVLVIMLLQKFHKIKKE
ncbi:MAG: zf-HC2 domain-containing protein [Acetatifactor sp.]|nr:zf-HC2 domain-containing protein [Acetatifactor sp.]